MWFPAKNVLVAAGKFDIGGGVATLNSTAWGQLSTTINAPWGLSGSMYCSILRNDGSIVWGGSVSVSTDTFSNAFIGTWTGDSYTSSYIGAVGTIYSLAESPDGVLYLGGNFPSKSNLAYFDKTTARYIALSPPSLLYQFNGLAFIGSTLAACGISMNTSVQAKGFFGYLDSKTQTTWTSSSMESVDTCSVLISVPSVGHLYMAGNFTLTASDGVANNIAFTTFDKAGSEESGATKIDLKNGFLVFFIFLIIQCIF